MVPARARTPKTRSTDDLTNHAATTPSRESTIYSSFLFIVYLKKLLCLPRCLVILRSPFEIILIFFAVHVGVDSFTRQTVRLFTYWTVKSVNIVFVHTPPLTVRGLTMEAVSSLTFCCSEASVQELVEILR